MPLVRRRNSGNVRTGICSRLIRNQSLLSELYFAADSSSLSSLLSTRLEEKEAGTPRCARIGTQYNGYQTHCAAVLGHNTDHARPSVRLSICTVRARNSETEKRGKPKIGVNVPRCVNFHFKK